MNKEIAMRTLAYLLTHFKEHDETIINLEEIQAIEFLQQENARLKDKIGKLKFAIESNCIKDGKKYQEICCDGDYLLEILKEN